MELIMFPVWGTPVECAVLDTYNYHRAASDEHLTAYLLAPISGRRAGLYLFRTESKGGAWCGTGIHTPTDLPGAISRVFDEWRAERAASRGEGTVVAAGVLRARLERANRMIRQPFGAKDVNEKTTEIKEAS